MKKLLKFLFVFAIALAGFASCSKTDDFDYEKAVEEERIKDSLNNVRIKKLIAEQAPELKAFADEHLTNGILHDSTGIWYEVIAAGDDASYDYSVSNGYVVAPTLSVKYKGTLLNGNIFDEKTEDVKLSLANVIRSWQLLILPKTLRFNGYNYQLGGLTTNGFKKGAKLKLVTPSPYAYDTSASTDGKIPANSPLYFEIEISEIK
ncbi:FKBP-type peptidyl-prolyl cis-trans isomerase [Sphingobacterium sp. LRF_L2]|uniref:FKBP-type peptidyl-prolyl cis-trans isomerase n=1 Tax=Sphingobacterium sp. LRF_L2 TaxID=3369421 RepID=UPI003F626D0F